MAPLLCYPVPWAHCILAARPSSGLCCGLAVTAGGPCSSSAPGDAGLFRLAQGVPNILLFPSLHLKPPPAVVTWWWWGCLPPPVLLFEAAEQGSHPCSAVWVTIGQSSAFSSVSQPLAPRDSHMRKGALRKPLAHSPALRKSSCEWLLSRGLAEHA